MPVVIPNTSQHVVSMLTPDRGACIGPPTISTVYDNWFLRGFAPWLSAIGNSSADSYVADWTIVGGQVMATKDVQWSDQGESFSGTFTLRHAPDPN